MDNKAFAVVNNKSLVVQSNELVEQPHKLSLREKKLVMLLASNINKEDAEFKPLRFKVLEIAKFIGVKENTGSIYPQIRALTKEMRKKGFEVEYKDEENKSRILQIGWLSSVEYFIGDGIVELSFDPKLKPLLLFIKNNFTKYEIGNIAHLRSIYSIRIYELLKQYQRIGYREFKIGDLKRILMIDKKTSYNNIVKFKEMIETAKTELKEKCDLAFDYELIKEVRKFTKIKFTFRKNEPLVERQASLFDADTKPVNEELKAELVALGFSEAVAVQLVQDYSEDRILNNVKYSLDRQSKGKIKSNFLGYTADAIKKDYANKSPYQRKKEEDAGQDKAKKAENIEALEKEKRIIDSFFAEYSSYTNDLFIAFMEGRDTESLQKEFFEQSNSFMQGQIKKHTFESRIIQGQLERYIKKNYIKNMLSFADWITKTKNVKVKQAGDSEKDIEFIS